MTSVSSTHFLWPFRYLLIAAAAAFLLWNLNYAPVWNPDEGRYVSASLEMFAPFDGSTPDWVVPHLNTIPRLNKPPLVYWCAATLFKFFGPSAAIARLVPALAAIGVLLVLWRMGTSMFGEKTGILAALVWVSSVLPFILARMLSTDMLLAFSTSLALLGIYKIIAPINNRLWSPGAVALAGIGLGLALLSKGPVGLLLPLSILVVWLFLVRLKTPAPLRTRAQSQRVLVGVMAALAIAGVLAAPWCLAIGRAHPQFLRNFLFGENLARFTGTTFYHEAEPFWFYVPVLIVGLLPWTAFLWPALRKFCLGFFVRRRITTAQETADLQAHTSQVQASQIAFSQNNARLFLWLWAAAVIGLFSISNTKLITYILPGLPALALLIADAFTGEGTRSNEKALRTANSVTIVVLTLFAIALGVAFSSTKLLADKFVPYAESTPFIALIALTMIGGAFSLWRAQRTAETSVFRRRTASTLVATGVVLFLTLVGFVGRFARYEDASPMLMALVPFLHPGDKVIQLKTFQPSAGFYLRAPTIIVDFVNTSGLEEGRFKSSPYFPTEANILKRYLQSPRRVYILTRWKYAQRRTLLKAHMIAINNDYCLLSNRPAPAGFHYDFIAPRERKNALSTACRDINPEC